METSYSKYQLWSPPALDLSLDSFTNDLIQEFDKTRASVDIGVQPQENSIDNDVIVKNETKTKHEEPIVPPSVADNSHPDTHLSSPVPSSVTLPPSERETSFHEEEDSSSTTNLFRKSSTFLKKKLSQSGHSKRDEGCSISTTNAEEITNIVSRQYPPKPLQYSPVVEAPFNSISASSTQADLPQNNRETEETSSVVTHNNRSINAKRVSEPIPAVAGNSSIAAQTSATATIAAAPITPAPKRRSIFSLRFC